MYVRAKKVIYVIKSYGIYGLSLLFCGSRFLKKSSKLLISNLLTTG